MGQNSVTEGGTTTTTDYDANGNELPSPDSGNNTTPPPPDSADPEEPPPDPDPDPDADPNPDPDSRQAGGGDAPSVVVFGAADRVARPALSVVLTPVVSVSDASGVYNGHPFTATATVAGADGVAAASLEGVSPTLTYYVGIGRPAIC